MRASPFLLLLVHSPDRRDSDAAIESVGKDLASLSKEEKLQLLEQDSPELLELLADLEKRIDEVKNHVVPLLKKYAQLCARGGGLLRRVAGFELNNCRQRRA